MIRASLERFRNEIPLPQYELETHLVLDSFGYPPLSVLKSAQYAIKEKGRKKEEGKGKKEEAGEVDSS